MRGWQPIFLTRVFDGETKRFNLCQSCAGPIPGQIPPAEWTSRPPSGIDPRIFERPPDCPAEVTIADSIGVNELATALHVKFFQVIAVLVQHGIFLSRADPLDFHTASLVCAHYEVIAHKIP